MTTTEKLISNLLKTLDARHQSMYPAPIGTDSDFKLGSLIAILENLGNDPRMSKMINDKIEGVIAVIDSLTKKEIEYRNANQFSMN